MISEALCNIIVYLNNIERIAEVAKENVEERKPGVKKLSRENKKSNTDLVRLHLRTRHTQLPKNN